MAIDRVPMGKYKNNRRRRKNRGKLSLKKLAKEVSSVKKQLKEDIEVKSYDGTLGLTAITWSGSTTTGLCTPSQGVGRSARIGSQVRVTGMDFRYYCQAGVTSANQALRVILFIDKSNVVSAPADVLEAAYLGTSAAPLAFFDRDKRQDIIVLHDQIHEFDYGSGNLQQYARKSIAKSFKIQFDDATAVIQENTLRVLAISNVSASAPTLEFACRTYYVDA